MVTCHFSSKERTKVVIVNRAFVREKSESFGRSGHLQHIIQLYNRYRDIFTYNLDHVICFTGMKGTQTYRTLMSSFRS